MTDCELTRRWVARVCPTGYSEGTEPGTVHHSPAMPAITLTAVRQAAAVRGMRIASTRLHNQAPVYHCWPAYWANRNLQRECGDTTPERNWLTLEQLKQWAAEVWGL